MHATHVTHSNDALEEALGTATAHALPVNFTVKHVRERQDHAPSKRLCKVFDEKDHVPSAKALQSRSEGMWSCSARTLQCRLEETWSCRSCPCFTVNFTGGTWTLVAPGTSWGRPYRKSLGETAAAGTSVTFSHHSQICQSAGSVWVIVDGCPPLFGRLGPLDCRATQCLCAQSAMQAPVRLEDCLSGRSAAQKTMLGRQSCSFIPDLHSRGYHPGWLQHVYSSPDA